MLLPTMQTFLYTQSLLIEGQPVDDPAGYANKICALLAR